MKQVVNDVADVHCPVVEIPTRSKLSCLSWNKCEKSLIASSDYEGIVTLWDVNTRQVRQRLDLSDKYDDVQLEQVALFCTILRL